MATPPPPTANEVLHLFGQALSQGPDSAEQASILSEIRRAIERDPSISTALYSTILSVAPRASYVLKRWIADVVEFVVARLAIVSNALSPDQRVHSESRGRRYRRPGLVLFPILPVLLDFPRVTFPTLPQPREADGVEVTGQVPLLPLLLPLLLYMRVRTPQTGVPARSSNLLSRRKLLLPSQLKGVSLSPKE